MVDGIYSLVNGQMSAKVLFPWMSIVARNVVGWNSTTTTLAYLRADLRIRLLDSHNC